MNSINEDKGLTINALELTFGALEKLLKTKIEENPKSGFIAAKGKPNEARIRYSEVLKNVQALRYKYGLDGAFSYGICENCKHFDTRGHSNGFGKCKYATDLVHRFSTCRNHTKSTGGFGL